LIGCAVSTGLAIQAWMPVPGAFEEIILAFNNKIRRMKTGLDFNPGQTHS
jgi:hypothetical protein